MKRLHRIKVRRCALGLGFVAFIMPSARLARGAEPASYEHLPLRGGGPHLLAEGVISTPGDEAGGVFSPDGNDFYFVKFNPTTTFPRIGLLCVAHWREGKWTKPEVLPFSGLYLDFPPRLSADGQMMYFASSRPAPGAKTRVLRIWRATKTPSGWSDPEPLPAPVNAPDDHWNWGASVTKDGTIYFTSDREKAGRPKIYRARMVDGAYQQAEKLPEPVNSDFNDYNPFVSADETMLFFVSAGNDAEHKREGTLFTGGYPYARGDIYFCRGAGGKWGAARHLEHGVNTVFDEDYPALTPDGKHLVFSSGRSSFTVPVAHRLTMDELERKLHSTLNGLGNIYTIPVGILDLAKDK